MDTTGPQNNSVEIVKEVRRPDQETTGQQLMAPQIYYPPTSPSSTATSSNMPGPSSAANGATPQHPGYTTGKRSANLIQTFDNPWLQPTQVVPTIAQITHKPLVGSQMEMYDESSTDTTAESQPNSEPEKTTELEEPMEHINDDVDVDGLLDSKSSHEVIISNYNNNFSNHLILGRAPVMNRETQKGPIRSRETRKGPLTLVQLLCKLKCNRSNKCKVKKGLNNSTINRTNHVLRENSITNRDEKRFILNSVLGKTRHRS